MLRLKGSKEALLRATEKIDDMYGYPRWPKRSDLIGFGIHAPIEESATYTYAVIEVVNGVGTMLLEEEDLPLLDPRYAQDIIIEKFAELADAGEKPGQESDDAGVKRLATASSDVGRSSDGVRSPRRKNQRADRSDS